MYNQRSGEELGPLNFLIRTTKRKSRLVEVEDEKDEWIINTFYQAPIDDIKFEIKHIKPSRPTVALKKRASLKR